MPFVAISMDLESIIPTEVWYYLYMEAKKLIQINLFTKQK